MTNLNKICMSALLLGAAAMATPAFAQAAASTTPNSPQAQPSAPADAAPMDKAATSPSASNTIAAQAAEQPASSTQAAAGTNTQVAAQDQAMTHDTDVKAAANANVDAAGDTSKKYVRKNRAADFAKEQSITAQLNQQASAAAAPGPSVR